MVEPTHLKNISQNGNLPQIGMNIKKYLKPPPRFYLHFHYIYHTHSPYIPDSSHGNGIFRGLVFPAAFPKKCFPAEKSLTYFRNPVFNIIRFQQKRLHTFLCCFLGLIVFDLWVFPTTSTLIATCFKSLYQKPHLLFNSACQKSQNHTPCIHKFWDASTKKNNL